MEFAYSFSGNSAIRRLYQVAATVSNAGVPLLAPTANDAGLPQATTTAAADVVGVAADTATYVTAQQTDGTSAQRRVGVLINPDAVWSMLLSGGATENTALTQYDVTTASSDGLTVTTGDNWSSPTFDEGTVWGYTGANMGAFRKITSVSTAAATVTVAFDYDTVIGDIFLRAPYTPFQSTAVQLTTNLYQANAAIAVGTGGPWRVIEMVLNSQALDGRTNSYILVMAQNPLWYA